MGDRDYDPPPINWLLCAKDYLELARFGYNGPLESHLDSNLPIYSLCAHAFELAFKAFLVCKGYPKEKIRRKFKHELLDLYEECVRNGLQPIIDEVAEIDLDNLSGMYTGDFIVRYPKGGYRPAKDLQNLFLCCSRVCDAVEVVCRHHCEEWAEARKARRR